MGNDVAKYPSDEQLTLLKSIFRDDQNYPLYEDIMKGFGDFVVGTILPAETYTDECRAGDFAGQLTARLEEIGAYTEQSV